MRISQFHMFQFACVVILSAAFVSHYQSLVGIIAFLLVVLAMARITYVKINQYSHVTLPLSRLVVCIIGAFSVAVWMIGTTNALVIHIGVVLFVCIILFMTNSFIKHAHMQAMQIERIQANMEQFNDSFLKVSAQRHDFMKHVHALDYLLEKDDAGEAATYMKQLIPDYKRINKSIKGEQGHIASVLLYFQQFANEHQIEFHVMLDEPLSHMSLPAHEQVQLIGNLVENALEAAKTTKQKKRGVTLTSQIVSGIYKIQITNTTEPIPNHIVDHLFSSFRSSTKTNGHGFGTSVIASLVSSYNGTIDYTYTGKKMTIRISLPIVDSPT